MNPSSSLRVLAAACLTAALSSACSEPESKQPTGTAPEPAAHPGTLVLNASIHTLAPADTGAVHGAMVFSEYGRLEAVGAVETLVEAYPGATVVDLGGRTVVPGLIDSHAHLAGLAQSFTRANLVGARSKDEALDRLREFAAGLPEDAWLLGRGWDQNDWPEPVFPNRQDLDAVFPDRPVWLRRIDGHAGWANTHALELAGITAGTPNQPGGAIDHEPETGLPTGILKETAMDLVADLFDDPSLDEAASAIKKAIANAYKQGLTGVHTMEGAAAFRAFQQLEVDGELGMRILIQIPEGNLDAAIQMGLRSGFGNERLRIGGLKAFADGARKGGLEF